RPAFVFSEGPLMAYQKRTFFSLNPDYVGIQGLNLVDANTVISGVAAVSFFDLASRLQITQFKCCLIFIDITNIVGTWDFKIATELRIAQVALGTTKFNPAGTLNSVGVTAVSKQRVGYNMWSGVNTIMGDVGYLEVRNTAGASPSVTLSADAVLYN
ncbi:MAG: hypothetical protein L0Z48_12470, partial [candidate division Zixibacteria bacterium]|nr:hypothetical protein [candidate division Zixibacteria bacterium]